MRYPNTKEESLDKRTLINVGATLLAVHSGGCLVLMSSMLKEAALGVLFAFLSITIGIPITLWVAQTYILTGTSAGILIAITVGYAAVWFISEDDL